MKEIEYNLLDEPWIRVLDKEYCIQEVSLRELLLSAHTFRAFAGELPTQDAAILRVALAVLHAVFSRTDETGNGDPPEDEADAMQLWKRIWDSGKLPEQPLNDYFAKWHERFWLFHPERPFYQVAGLDRGTEYDSAKLNGALSESGNKLRLFSEYTGERKQHLQYAEAARWLLYVNAYDDTSSKPSKEGKAVNGKMLSPGIGWLGKLGLVWITGETLFETLMRNLVLVNQGEISEHELPIWERGEVPTGERVQIPPPDNLSELYTIQSRRLFLFREDAYVTGYRLLGGDFFDREKIAFFEPMTVWYGKTDKTGTIYAPRRHDASIQMWRELSVYLGTNQLGNSTPGVIQWNQALMSAGYLPYSMMLNIQIASVQYGDKDFFVKHVFSDQLQLHLSLLSDLGAAWRQYIQDEIKLCGDAANCISLLAKDLYFASGGDNDDDKEKSKLKQARNSAKEQLYFAFDIPFRRWISRIEADSDHVALQKEWRKEAERITKEIGRKMIRQAGEPAMIGRTLTINEKKHTYAAPKAWGIFLASLRKLYQTGGEQAS